MHKRYKGIEKACLKLQDIKENKISKIKKSRAVFAEETVKTPINRLFKILKTLINNETIFCFYF